MESQRLEEYPITLFKRAGSPFWYARFSTRGSGQQRVGLNTEDNGLARRTAIEIFVEAKLRVQHGLSIKRRNFLQTADEYAAAVSSLASEQAVINRYFVPYFGTKLLEQIDGTEFERYLDWRQTYWTRGPGKDIRTITYKRSGKEIIRPAVHKEPSPSRLRNEGVMFHKILKFAKMRGYIGRLPETPLPKAKDNPRTAFTPAQFAALDELARQRLMAPDIDKVTRRERTRLWCYIIIMSYSGLRVTEARRLNWEDVVAWSPSSTASFKDRDIELRAWGKGRNLRQFSPKLAVIPAFDLLWKMVVQQFGSVKASDPVFTNERGQRVGSFKKGLEKLLEDCGLIRDHKGMKRGPGSFRHYYGTMQKIASVDTLMLSKVMGTSEKMIERFYGHVQASDAKEAVRRQWKTA